MHTQSGRIVNQMTEGAQRKKKKNQLSPSLTEHIQNISRNMSLEIQVLDWERHKMFRC